MELLKDSSITNKNINQSVVKTPSHPLLSQDWKSE